MGDEKPKDNKLFIGGLHVSTNTEDLKGYFETYGEITDAIVMRDPNTKRSRGFGFVTYANSDAVDECLAARPHVLDGREVEAKIAVPREENNPTAHSKTKKVFLGGLSLDTTEDDIREVLEGLGIVKEVTIMREKETNKPRGFGFATFDDTDVVDKLCNKRYTKIKERDVEVKKAVSQEEMRRSDVPSRGRSGGPPGGNYGGSRDPTAAYGGARDYYSRGNVAPYDYSRYPGATGVDYSRQDPYAYANAYPTAYGDRTSAAAYYASGYGSRTGYDQMQAAAAYGMYGAAGMAASMYSQSPSNYGPSRGSYGGANGAGDYGKDRGTGRNYHPYKRTQ